MAILERDTQLGGLRALIAAAGAGRGAMVLLGGESGAGKTALVRTFIEATGYSGEAMVGACDPLGTPRPLGPLLDISRALGREFESIATEDFVRADLFGRVLAALGVRRKPDLVVFEDLHWADDATLDLLRFLGRRIATRRCLLVVTFRDDELNPTRSLRRLFGDLVTMSAVHRLHLPPLSPQAVEILCVGTSLDAAAVHSLTGGNPFFVREVIRAGMSSPPSTVRDAVMVRLERIPPVGRRVLEAAAVIGRTFPLNLLRAVAPDALSGVDVCIETGLLRRVGDSLEFRHELVRLAVEEGTPWATRTSLHAATLTALSANRADRNELSRLAWHAEAAGDGDAVLTYAPAAAEYAAEVLAHHESAAHYRVALQFAGKSHAAYRADLLQRFANEAYLSGQLTAALGARLEAATLWSGVGDRLQEGENLVWVSRLTYLSGLPREAERLAAEAVAILAGLLAGPELALAYNNAAWLRMLACDLGEAVKLARRSVKLAQRSGNRGIALHAQITIGASEFQAGDDRGRTRLEAAFDAARDARLEEQAGRSIWNLALLSLWHRRYGLSDGYLRDGMEYCIEHELDSWHLLLLAARARWLLEKGSWAAAAETAEQVLGDTERATLPRVMALTVLGRLRARQGSSDAIRLIDEALALATEHQWLGPFAAVAPARAETLCLAGDEVAAAATAQSGCREAARVGDPWQVGELAFWALRAGAAVKPEAPMAKPYELALAGDWAAAAAHWRDLGCPYEAAQCLALAEDEAVLRQALAAFDGLGAVPAAADVRRHLRELGAVAIPRGPRAATPGRVRAA